MISVQSAKISSSFLAWKQPFIYMIYCPNIPQVNVDCIYIGESMGQFGALGRLSQHLSQMNNNTFIQRIQSLYNLNEFILNNIYFFGHNLPPEKKYTHTKEYREVIEFRVQENLINLFALKKYSIPVISRTRKNGYYTDKGVIKYSSLITSEFIKKIEEIL